MLHSSPLIFCPACISISTISLRIAACVSFTFCLLFPSTLLVLGGLAAPHWPTGSICVQYMCNYAALFYPKLAFSFVCCWRRHTQFLLQKRLHIFLPMPFSPCLSVFVFWWIRGASFLIQCVNEEFVEPFSSLLAAACVGSSSILRSSTEGG